MVFKYSAGNPTRLCDHIFQAPFFTPILRRLFQKSEHSLCLVPCDSAADNSKVELCFGCHSGDWSRGRIPLCAV